jgi:LPS-assembly protein
MLKKQLKNLLIKRKEYLLLVQIIFLAIFQNIFSYSAFASNELQFQFGDSVSIYSEKAYRREGGKIFEAIGNVVVLSGNDTIYGERVSFNIKSGDVLIEGSVRYVGHNITIYGSKISYNLVTGKLDMTNCRMITPEFSIVANKIIKKSEKIYYATDAEFTTCRDCAESWLISGKELHIEIDQYVQIYHAIAKVKGVDVIYIPYIALPIKNSRESGLLFPKLEARSDEGIIYEQPIYWAINNSQDATFTPTFAAKRGYGLNLEYRHVYGDRRWMEFSNKVVSDSIYEPEVKDSTMSGNYFRSFYEFENQYQWSNDLSQYLRVTGTKDLDFIRDYSYYTDEFIQESDLGASFFLDKRFDNFSLALIADYRRNILVSDPNDYDRSYVQTLPSVELSISPQMAYQSRSDYFYKVNYGLDTSLTVFKQDEREESSYLRNVNRIDAKPYIELSVLNKGPFLLKSKYTIDYQDYKFHDEDQDRFNKHAAVLSTELSFTIDRIFGLAYEEKYDISEIKEEDIIKIKDSSAAKADKKIPVKKSSSNIIGKLPNLENSISEDFIKIAKNSYRHSQEYKFIHHRLTSQSKVGNKNFLSQLGTDEGWFDLNDAILGDLEQIESNETRKTIPLENTVEFQWNNSLIRKSPKKLNYLIDNRYLKDNFTYSKIGYFNLSQGFLLNSTADEFKDKLTRLFLSSGYNAQTWNLTFNDYYFHTSDDHIVSLSGQKRFNRLSLISTYNANSFSDSNLKTIKAGFQFKPIDVLGFSFLKEHDIDASENISSIYQVDFMPHNNCWIINFNYKESFIEQRYAFNFEFNFGSEEFKSNRNNFFDFGRLQ